MGGGRLSGRDIAKWIRRGCDGSLPDDRLRLEGDKGGTQSLVLRIVLVDDLFWWDEAPIASNGGEQKGRVEATKTLPDDEISRGGRLVPERQPQRKGLVEVDGAWWHCG